MARTLPWWGRKSGRGAQRPPWSQPRALTPALLAIGLAGLVSASAVRNQPLTAEAPAPASPTPLANAPAVARVDRGEIDAVARAVARRYRISEDATRELVSTAYREGRRIGLDPLLIVAVMAVESHFNPLARSDGGALGLMQVIPRYHAAQFDPAGGESVLDPRTNIELGARVLKDCIHRGGTEVAGLQRYNGASGDPSNDYANKVLHERQRLQEALRRSRQSYRA